MTTRVSNAVPRSLYLWLAGFVAIAAALTLWLVMYSPYTVAYTFEYQYEQNIDGVLVGTRKESCVRFNPNKSNIEDIKRYFIQLHPVDSGVLSISDGCPKASMTRPRLNELYL